jgi:hypothetical protein
MTSKERVRAAVAGRAVDRIPLGFYLVDCDTISRVIGRPTYVRNRIGAQLALWEGRRDEVVESYQRDTVEFYEKIGCADIICFKEAPLVPPKDYDPDPPRRLDEETWEDRDGNVYRHSRISNELVCVRRAATYDVDDFTEDMYPPPDASEIVPPDPSIFEACRYVAEKLGPDRYIAGFSGGMNAFPLLGGQVTGLMMYAVKPEVVRAYNRRSVAIQNALDAYYVLPHQDGVLFEEDVGTTKGPMISPPQFRMNCFPYLKERIEHIRAFGHQIIWHNCGDNRLLIDMYVEAGVDCYESIQTIPTMELGSLVDEFGDRMSFWGGVPVEHLVMGTPEDVRKDVRYALEVARRGRGFILGPSHSIAYGTKYDNFMAMLDEYRRLTDR